MHTATVGWMHRAAETDRQMHKHGAIVLRRLYDFVDDRKQRFVN